MNSLFFFTEDNKEILSDPVCFDKYQFPVTGKCINSTWNFPEIIKCFTTNKKKMDFDEIGCQPGFENIGNFCVFLNKNNQKWNNTCLKYGGNFKAFKQFLKQKNLNNLLNLTKFWIPVSSRGNYEPYLWKIPEKYNQPFDDVKINNEFNGNCLIYDLIEMKFYAKDCNEQFPTLCVDDVYSDLIKLACPEDYYTTTFEGFQNYCFKISDNESFANESYLFSFTSVEKRFIFQRLINHVDSKSRVITNIFPNEKFENIYEFQLNDKLSNLNYTNWNQSLKIDNRTKYITANFHGKWNLGETYDYVAYEKEIEMKEPQMFLKFNAFKRKLTLTVSSNEFIWREDDDDSGITCFTNADKNLLQTIEVDDLITEEELESGVKCTIYKIDIKNDNPGEYWCSALALPNFKEIQTKKVIAWKNINGPSYSVLINVLCGLCDNISTNDYTENLAKDLKETLSSYLIDEVRVMKIDLISKPNARFIFHITINTDNESDDSDEDEMDDLGLTDNVLSLYLFRKNLRKILETMNSKSLKYHYISLNSTEYCLPESLMSSIFNLNWLAAKIGESTVPKELCVSANGIPAHRRCVGDFIYGAVWGKYNFDQGICNKTVDSITQKFFEFGKIFFYFFNI